MSNNARDLWIVRNARRLSDLVSKFVSTWSSYHRRTIGDQMLRAADSVGANLAEGYGRHHVGDGLRFYYIARGSLEETLDWLRKAIKRDLIDRNKGAILIMQYLQLSRSIKVFITYHQSTIDK